MTARLIHNIARQHPCFGLKVWRNGVEYSGEIAWDMNDLVVTDSDEEPMEYPRLWKRSATWISKEWFLVSAENSIIDMIQNARFRWGFTRPLEIWKLGKSYCEKTFVLLDADCHDGLNVKISVDIGECEQHLETNMIHY
jgi:hypothetical protein